MIVQGYLLSILVQFKEHSGALGSLRNMYSGAFMRK